MNDALEYIEAYFEKQLGESEMRQFEQRCEQDNLFAQDVAMYITTREAVKQALLEQKQQQWRTVGQERIPAAAAPVRKLAVRRWLPYAAAACVLLFVAVNFFTARQALNRQVDSYVQEELSTVSPNMGASADSMELGKSAMDDKNYSRALQLFSAVAQSDKTNDEAVLYAGYASRAMKDYDRALQYFDELANRKQLEVNKGLYNKALTLLQRNKKGDKEAAAQVLHDVVNGSLSGSEEAQKLLDLIK